MDTLAQAWSWLAEPLGYAFMQRALTATVLVGAVCGLVGCFVVVRGMAFFGDALAHTVLPGVAIAYILGRDLFVGGLAAGLLSALGVAWLTREGRLKEDTAIGVVFVTMFALGIAIISSTRAYSTDLAHILFGNVLGVRASDLRVLAASGAVLLVLVVLFYKELLVFSFDVQLARTLRLPAEALRLLLLAMVALCIVASLQTVGVSLVLALLVTPAATAWLLVKRLHHMLLLSVVLGVSSGVAGLYVSFYYPVASGAAMVLASSAVFALVYAGTQAAQTLSHWRGKREVAP